MSEIDLSFMNTEDIKEVAIIEKEIFSMPWSEKAFEETISKDMTIYVTAKIKGKLAGYCGLYKSFDEAEITNVAVDVKYRRNKVAETMLKHLILEAKEQGIQKFILEVRQSNAAAIHLYNKLSFKSVGVRKDFYERPTENAIIMIASF